MCSLNACWRSCRGVPRGGESAPEQVNIYIPLGLTWPSGYPHHSYKGIAVMNNWSLKKWAAFGFTMWGVSQCPWAPAMLRNTNGPLQCGWLEDDQHPPPAIDLFCFLMKQHGSFWMPRSRQPLDHGQSVEVGLYTCNILWLPLSNSMPVTNTSFDACYSLNSSTVFLWELNSSTLEQPMVRMVFKWVQTRKWEWPRPAPHCKIGQDGDG